MSFPEAFSAAVEEFSPENSELVTCVVQTIGMEALMEEIESIKKPKGKAPAKGKAIAKVPEKGKAPAKTAAKKVEKHTCAYVSKGKDGVVRECEKDAKMQLADTDKWYCGTEKSGHYKSALNAHNKNGGAKTTTSKAGAAKAAPVKTKADSLLGKTVKRNDKITINKVGDYLVDLKNHRLVFSDETSKSVIGILDEDDETLITELPQEVIDYVELHNFGIDDSVSVIAPKKNAKPSAPVKKTAPTKAPAKAPVKKEVAKPPAKGKAPAKETAASKKTAPPSKAPAKKPVASKGKKVVEEELDEEEENILTEIQQDVDQSDVAPDDEEGAAEDADIEEEDEEVGDAKFDLDEEDNPEEDIPDDEEGAEAGDVEEGEEDEAEEEEADDEDGEAGEEDDAGDDD